MRKLDRAVIERILNYCNKMRVVGYCVQFCTGDATIELTNE